MTRSWARSRPSQPGSPDSPGDANRTVLHCNRRRRLRHRRDPGRRYGAGHQEAPAAVLGPVAHRRWPRRSPPTSSVQLGEANLVAVRQRRAPLPVRRVDPRRRRLHHPDALAAPVNDAIMEQLIMIDAAKRASAKRITAVCPFYGYARQDRKAEGREPITAKLVADMLGTAGANRIVGVDLHSGQIQGFFDGPVDHLTAMPVLVDYLHREVQGDLVDRLPRRGPGEGGRALQSAPRCRPRLRAQAPAQGRGERRSRPVRSSATSKGDTA